MQGDILVQALETLRFRLMRANENDMELVNDVIEELRLQVPRVLTLEDLMGFDGAFIIEYNPAMITRNMKWAIFHYMYDGWVYFEYPPRQERYASNQYGVSWRCWTARPTEAEREAVAWDG